MSFVKPDGTPYKYICFYGPNGVGKSSVIEAISKLTMNTAGRSDNFVANALNKYVRNVDYNPQYDALRAKKYQSLTTDKGELKFEEGEWSEKDKKPEMTIEGTYFDDETDKQYVVNLSQSGYKRNDFAPIAEGQDLEPEEISKVRQSGLWGEDHLLYRQRICHFITSDSDLSLNKIQVHESQIGNFEEIITEVMRYQTECIPPSGTTKYDRDYATDVVINKEQHGETFRIHFKRMSAGERKICKSFSSILNLIHDLECPAPGEISMSGWPRLLLIDNVVMHVYYDRHVTMVDCLKKVFNKQQIFSTTHSGILIPRAQNKENSEDELYIDLEKLTT